MNDDFMQANSCPLCSTDFKNQVYAKYMCPYMQRACKVQEMFVLESPEAT